MTEDPELLSGLSASEAEADAQYAKARYRTRVRYEYRARFLSPSQKQARARRLIEKLGTLERASDPFQGAQTAQSKDEKAREALMIAGQLLEAVAGWAVHHQMGLAAERQQPLPTMSSLLRENEAVLNARAQLDQHHYEAIGSGIVRHGLDMSPAQTRQAISNVLRPMSVWAPSFRGLFAETASAMEDLNRGAAPPLTTQEKPRGTSMSSRMMDLKIFALAFIEYNIARGLSARESKLKVSEAYKMEDDSMRNWKRAIIKSGNTHDYIRLMDEIATARYGGQLFSQYSAETCPVHLRPARRGLSQRYSEERLEKAGHEYKNRSKPD